MFGKLVCEKLYIENKQQKVMPENIINFLIKLIYSGIKTRMILNFSNILRIAQIGPFVPESIVP